MRRTFEEINFILGITLITTGLITGHFNLIGLATSPILLAYICICKERTAWAVKLQNQKPSL